MAEDENRADKESALDAEFEQEKDVLAQEAGEKEQVPREDVEHTEIALEGATEDEVKADIIEKQQEYLVEEDIIILEYDQIKPESGVMPKETDEKLEFAGDEFEQKEVALAKVTVDEVKVEEIEESHEFIETDTLITEDRTRIIIEPVLELDIEPEIDVIPPGADETGMVLSELLDHPLEKVTVDYSKVKVQEDTFDEVVGEDVDVLISVADGEVEDLTDEFVCKEIALEEVCVSKVEAEIIETPPEELVEQDILITEDKLVIREPVLEVKIELERPVMSPEVDEEIKIPTEEFEHEEIAVEKVTLEETEEEIEKKAILGVEDDQGTLAIKEPVIEEKVETEADYLPPDADEEVEVPIEEFELEEKVLEKVSVCEFDAELTEESPKDVAEKDILTVDDSKLFTKEPVLKVKIEPKGDVMPSIVDKAIDVPNEMSEDKEIVLQKVTVHEVKSDVISKPPGELVQKDIVLIEEEKLIIKETVLEDKIEPELDIKLSDSDKELEVPRGEFEHKDVALEEVSVTDEIIEKSPEDIEEKEILIEEDAIKEPLMEVKMVPDVDIVPPKIDENVEVPIEDFEYKEVGPGKIIMDEVKHEVIKKLPEELTEKDIRAVDDDKLTLEMKTEPEGDIMPYDKDETIDVLSEEFQLKEKTVAEVSPSEFKPKIIEKTPVDIEDRDIIVAEDDRVKVTIEESVMKVKIQAEKLGSPSEELEHKKIAFEEVGMVIIKPEGKTDVALEDEAIVTEISHVEAKTKEIAREEEPITVVTAEDISKTPEEGEWVELSLAEETLPDSIPAVIMKDVGSQGEIEQEVDVLRQDVLKREEISHVEAEVIEIVREEEPATVIKGEDIVTPEKEELEEEDLADSSEVSMKDSGPGDEMSKDVVIVEGISQVEAEVIYDVIHTPEQAELEEIILAEDEFTDSISTVSMKVIESEGETEQVTDIKRPDAVITEEIVESERKEIAREEEQVSVISAVDVVIIPKEVGLEDLPLLEEKLPDFIPADIMKDVQTKTQAEQGEDVMLQDVIIVEEITQVEDEVEDGVRDIEPVTAVKEDDIVHALEEVQLEDTILADEELIDYVSQVDIKIIKPEGKTDVTLEDEAIVEEISHVEAKTKEIAREEEPITVVTGEDVVKLAEEVGLVELALTEEELPDSIPVVIMTDVGLQRETEQEADVLRQYVLKREEISHVEAEVIEIIREEDPAKVIKVEDIVTPEEEELEEKDLADSSEVSMKDSGPGGETEQEVDVMSKDVVIVEEISQVEAEVKEIAREIEPETAIKIYDIIHTPEQAGVEEIVLAEDEFTDSISAVSIKVIESEGETEQATDILYQDVVITEEIVETESKEIAREEEPVTVARAEYVVKSSTEARLEDLPLLGEKIPDFIPVVTMKDVEPDAQIEQEDDVMRQDVIIVEEITQVEDEVEDIGHDIEPVTAVKEDDIFHIPGDVQSEDTILVEEEREIEPEVSTEISKPKSETHGLRPDVAIADEISLVGPEAKEIAREEEPIIVVTAEDIPRAPEEVGLVELALAEEKHPDSIHVVIMKDVKPQREIEQEADVLRQDVIRREVITHVETEVTEIDREEELATVLKVEDIVTLEEEELEEKDFADSLEVSIKDVGPECDKEQEVVTVEEISQVEEGIKEIVREIQTAPAVKVDIIHLPGQAELEEMVPAEEELTDSTSEVGMKSVISEGETEQAKTPEELELEILPLVEDKHPDFIPVGIAKDVRSDGQIEQEEVITRQDVILVEEIIQVEDDVKERVHDIEPVTTVKEYDIVHTPGVIQLEGMILVEEELIESISEVSMEISKPESETDVIHQDEVIAEEFSQMEAEAKELAREEEPITVVTGENIVETPEEAGLVELTLVEGKLPDSLSVVIIKDVGPEGEIELEAHVTRQDVVKREVISHVEAEVKELVREEEPVTDIKVEGIVTPIEEEFGEKMISHSISEVSIKDVVPESEIEQDVDVVHKDVVIEISQVEDEVKESISEKGQRDILPLAEGELPDSVTEDSMKHHSPDEEIRLQAEVMPQDVVKQEEISDIVAEDKTIISYEDLASVVRAEDRDKTAEDKDLDEPVPVEEELPYVITEVSMRDVGREGEIEKEDVMSQEIVKDDEVSHTKADVKEISSKEETMTVVRSEVIDQVREVPAVDVRPYSIFEVTMEVIETGSEIEHEGVVLPSDVVKVDDVPHMEDEEKDITREEEPTTIPWTKDTSIISEEEEPKEQTPAEEKILVSICEVTMKDTESKSEMDEESDAIPQYVDKWEEISHTEDGDEELVCKEEPGSVVKDIYKGPEEVELKELVSRVEEVPDSISEVSMDVIEPGGEMDQESDVMAQDVHKREEISHIEAQYEEIICEEELATVVRTEDRDKTPEEAKVKEPVPTLEKHPDSTSEVTIKGEIEKKSVVLPRDGFQYNEVSHLETDVKETVRDEHFVTVVRTKVTDKTREEIEAEEIVLGEEKRSDSVEDGTREDVGLKSDTEPGTYGISQDVVKMEEISLVVSEVKEFVRDEKEIVSVVRVKDIDKTPEEVMLVEFPLAEKMSQESISEVSMKDVGPEGKIEQVSDVIRQDVVKHETVSLVGTEVEEIVCDEGSLTVVRDADIDQISKAIELEEVVLAEEILPHSIPVVIMKDAGLQSEVEQEAYVIRQDEAIVEEITQVEVMDKTSEEVRMVELSLADEIPEDSTSEVSMKDVELGDEIDEEAFTMPQREVKVDEYLHIEEEFKEIMHEEQIAAVVKDEDTVETPERTELMEVVSAEEITLDLSVKHLVPEGGIVEKVDEKPQDEVQVKEVLDVKAQAKELIHDFKDEDLDITLGRPYSVSEVTKVDIELEGKLEQDEDLILEDIVKVEEVLDMEAETKIISQEESVSVFMNVEMEEVLEEVELKEIILDEKKLPEPVTEISMKDEVIKEVKYEAKKFVPEEQPVRIAKADGTDKSPEKGEVKEIDLTEEKLPGTIEKITTKDVILEGIIEQQAYLMPQDVDKDEKVSDVDVITEDYIPPSAVIVEDTAALADEIISGAIEEVASKDITIDKIDQETDVMAPEDIKKQFSDLELARKETPPKEHPISVITEEIGKLTGQEEMKEIILVEEILLDTLEEVTLTDAATEGKVETDAVLQDVVKKRKITDMVIEKKEIVSEDESIRVGMTKDIDKTPEMEQVKEIHPTEETLSGAIEEVSIQDIRFDEKIEVQVDMDPKDVVKETKVLDEEVEWEETSVECRVKIKEMEKSSVEIEKEEIGIAEKLLPHKVEKDVPKVHTVEARKVSEVDVIPQDIAQREEVPDIAEEKGVDPEKLPVLDVKADETEKSFAEVDEKQVAIGKEKLLDTKEELTSKDVTPEEDYDGLVQDVTEKEEALEEREITEETVEIMRFEEKEIFKEFAEMKMKAVTESEKEDATVLEKGKEIIDVELKDVDFASSSQDVMPHDTLARRKRKEHLVIETTSLVTETDVKELMSRVKEVTQQIKEEVREMKPDLTPTPEGKDLSLPLSESREFLEISELIPIKEESFLAEKVLIGSPLDDFETSQESVETGKIDMSLDERPTSVEGDISVDMYDKGVVPQERIDHLLEIPIHDTDVRGSHPPAESLDEEPLKDQDHAAVLDERKKDLKEYHSRIESEVSPIQVWKSLEYHDVTVKADSGVDLSKVAPVEASSTDVDVSLFPPEGCDSIPDEFLKSSYETESPVEFLVTASDDRRSDILITESDRTDMKEPYFVHSTPRGTSSEILTEETEGERTQEKVPSSLAAKCIPSVEEDSSGDELIAEDAKDRQPRVVEMKSDISLSQTTLTERKPLAEALIRDSSELPTLISPSETEPSMADFVMDSRHLSLIETPEDNKVDSTVPELKGAILSIPKMSAEDGLKPDTTPGLTILTGELPPGIATDGYDYVIGSDGVADTEEEQNLVFEATGSTVMESPSEIEYSSQFDSTWESSKDSKMISDIHDIRRDTDTRFGVSPEDIVMKDDLLEVTVTEKDHDQSFVRKGLLLTSSTGATYVEFDSDGRRSVCVCEEATSELVELHAPQPSTSKAGLDASSKGRGKKFGGQKRDTEKIEDSPISKSKIKSKKKPGEKQLSQDSTRKTGKDSQQTTASKRVDDRLTLTRRSRDVESVSDKGLPGISAKKRVDDRWSSSRRTKAEDSAVDSSFQKRRSDDRFAVTRKPRDRETRPDTIQTVAAASRHDTRVYGYMASTLSRDLKVGHTVTDKTWTFSREASFRKRSGDREDSSLSPSKLQQKKVAAPSDSTGAVSKSPQKHSKKPQVESRSVSLEKETTTTTSKKQIKVQSSSSLSRRTRSSTSVVSPTVSRSAASQDDRASGTSRYTGKKVISQVHKEPEMMSTVKQSRSQTRKLELETTHDRGRRRRPREIPPSDDRSLSGEKVRSRKQTPESTHRRSPSKVVPEEPKKEITETHHPPSISSKEAIILQQSDYSEQLPDHPTFHSLESPTSIEALVDLEQVSSNLSDSSEKFQEPITPCSAAPSLESSPSIKSVLDKSSVVVSEKKVRRESAPSPPPSASPIKSVTRADRHASFDYSHTPPSLPSSPSRLRGQPSAGVTQLLTSEVFTRTVDASGSIEVIYRQPTSYEALRRVATVSGSRSLHESTAGIGEAEFSLIDTTDSSLSDSVALPSSSSDHDLSLDANVRLRTSGSPASPKPTRRSLDLIHDSTGQKIRTSDLVLEGITVPASEAESYPDVTVPSSERTSPHESVPTYESEGSPGKMRKETEHSSPHKRTQISEERLSPILDVRAVTPPRVKHKFHYVADEESADAAFLPSPEWSGIPQEQRKASDMKDQLVEPPTKSMAKGAMESSATGEKPNVVHMERGQDLSDLKLQENQLKDFITPLTTETKLPLTEDEKVHDDLIKETAQNLTEIRQEHISQGIQKLVQTPVKLLQEATVDVRSNVQEITELSVKETLDKGPGSSELVLQRESPEMSAEVPKVPYNANENIPPLVPDTIKMNDKIEIREVPDVTLWADKKSIVDPESLEAEQSQKDIEQVYIRGISDSACSKAEIHHEVVDDQVKFPEERRASTDRKNIFSTQDITKELQDERVPDTATPYVSKASHKDDVGDKHVRKEVEDYFGAGKSNVIENQDIKEVEAEQASITVSSSVTIEDTSKSEVDTSEGNIRYTGLEKESDITLPYVTTPTSQRRGLSGGSQRLTRDQRPPPLDVSHLMLDDDDDDDDDDAGDECYIVTEPIDDKKLKLNNRTGDGIAHINSSPDILSDNINPLMTERNVGQTVSQTSPKRRPLFHIESEEDDLLEFTKGTNMEGKDSIDATQYIQGKTAMEINNEIKSEELLLREEEEETASKQNKLEKNLLESEGDKVLPMEEIEKEIKEERGDSLELTGLISFSENINLTGKDLEDVASENVDENGQEEVKDGQTPDKQEKKLRRVERRFERMASETLESEAAEGTSTPEVEQRREAEFQRIVSQLSTEEVANCQNEYSQLWDEGGLTPSEEWDSHDPDTPSCELDEHSAPNQDEHGIQSVCTQVTSQSHTPVPEERDGYNSEEDIQRSSDSVQSNGPTQVEYVPEYDDFEEARKRPTGHRRKESTSHFVPLQTYTDKTFEPISIPEISKMEIEGLEDMAESDKYAETGPLTLKEVRSDEKKDIDEAEKLDEESYQTEADQGFHRDLREGRVLLEEIASVEEDTEVELRELDSSRPQSQVSKSDSEGGHRPMSSGFSDDRPDSELAELLKQCSSDGGRDLEDPIERPLSPEPVDECELKDDTPEFSSEAQASITELEIEYSGAFSRSMEYASHVSPICEERISTQYDEACSIEETEQSGWEQQVLEREDDMAEAEAAFQMAPHVFPAIQVALPATIPEDDAAEKHELETRERVLKEGKRHAQEVIVSSPTAIPDIMVTQHMTPLVDRGFHYPDLELEEVARSAPQTPASVSSRASSETETDQGREYVLEEEDIGDFISEEPELEDTQEEKATETRSVEEVSAADDRTVYESHVQGEVKEDISSPATESPTSDSFEMLEKPDITDEYVVVEEVGKEAEEHDSEGKSVHIEKKSRSTKKKPPAQEDEVLIPSPPAPTTRMTDLKYYPDAGPGEDVGPFPFESDSPPTTTTTTTTTSATAVTKKSVGVRTQEGRYEQEEGTYDRDVEAGKKWIEMQFQADHVSGSAAGYGYEMEFERIPLEDIKEEEVNDFDQSSSKVGSIGSYQASIGSFGSIKESLSSTPEYDVLAGRKFFTRSGEHDDVSMSSLQEFEHLEKQIALENARKRSHGSQDSLNGNNKRYGHSRSGQGDDISLSSLKEFEGLETACIEAAKIETRAKEEEALLSEIEEGHESQVSESESCETMSGAGARGGGGESVDSDDYEKRMFEIDEIIRQAQSNVERFVETKDRVIGDEGTESSVLDRTESVGRGDSLEEVARVPELDLDQPLYTHSVITSSKIASYSSHSWREPEGDAMETSTDSLESKLASGVQDPMHGSTDSLDLKTVADKSGDIMTASADSIEFQMHLSTGGQIDPMTDSIELPTDVGTMAAMATSTDSLDLAAPITGAVTSTMTDSIEEEEEISMLGQGEGPGSGGQDQSSSSGREGDLSSSGAEQGGAPPPGADLMLGSTDSLEPSSSTATHATYQYETDSVMSSSFTSGGSNTMVSSTDTLDPTGAVAGGLDSMDLVAAAARSGMWFEDANSSGRPFVTEVIEPCEEDEFSHTVRRTVELPPEVRKVAFRGPDAEKALQEYIERFAPGEDVSETQEIDDEGNIHIKRVVQRRVVVRSEDVGETQLSGPELEEYFRDISQESGITEPTFGHQTSAVSDSDYSHLLSSISGSETSSFPSPPHSTEVVTHRTYVTRHVIPPSHGAVVETQQGLTTPHLTDEISAVGREQQHLLHQEAPDRDSVSCRLPLHDISIDDDEAEIDLHEHDWRFQHHHPAEPEDEVTISPHGTARSPIQTTDRRVVDGDSTTTVITTTTVTSVPSQETDVTEKGATDVEKESKAK